MNIKDHLSDEMLGLILAGKPGEETGTAKLHLSYCPICRDRKDDLVLKRAAEQMWHTYDRSAPAAADHVKESVLRKFWLGQIVDDEIIKQISNHCIVCRHCRLNRETVRTQIEEERRQMKVLLLFAAIQRGVKRRRRAMLSILSIVLSAAGLIAVLFALKFLPFVEPPQQHSAHNPPQSIEGQNSEAPRGANQNSQVHDPAPSPKPTPLPAGELLAQAQRIDIPKAMDRPETRDPESTAPAPAFEIVASRSSSTVLRIVLPADSKRGMYDVSVREPAFLDELVAAKGSSSDGVSLVVLLDLRQLKTDAYVLRIVRRDLKTNREEYVGDFNVRLVDKKSRR